MKTWWRPSSSPQSPSDGDKCAASATSWIDAHVHVFPPELVADRKAYLGIDSRFDALYSSSAATMATAADVLEQMESSGVETSVIFGFSFCDVAVCRQINDYVIQVVREAPDRLVGLASVPWGAPGAAAELERCLDAGLRGCGELTPSSGEHEELVALRPTADMLRERGLPLLVHASEPVGHKYPGKGRFTPEASIALAQMYPGLTLVLSHLGGGAFVYELMPEIRAAMTDVLYDTAAIPYLYSPQVYEVAVRAVGAGKLVFGSDYPLLAPTRCAEGLEGLSLEDQDAVRQANARRIFGL